MNDARQQGEFVEGIAFTTILAPLLEHWRSWVVSATIGSVLVLIGVFALPWKYDASLQLAVVSNTKPLSGLAALGGAPSLLSGALGGLQSNGLHPTPPLVVAIMRSGDVLRAVGSASAGSGARTIADAIAGRPTRPDKVAEVVARIVRTEVSAPTGTIRLTVSSTDSGLARRVALLILDKTSLSYVAIMRAQAHQQRLGQEVRVDSAARQLEAAERALTEFEAANRSLTRFSEKILERQALERRVQLAQQVYLQAATEREAAVAQELEVTPVLAVVDGIPSALPRARRFVGLLMVLGIVVATLAWGAVVLAREGVFRNGAEDPELARLRRAIAGLPWPLSRGRRGGAA